jgi:hypothetical protein
MARQFREQLEQEADALQRSADLRTPPGTTSPSPAPAPAPAPAAAAPAAAAPAAAAPAAAAPAAAGAEYPEHHEQPAAPPAESHERTG